MLKESIPRAYLSGIDERVLPYKFCGYCDASLNAYAAMIYLLIEIVSSKTRVSLLKKQITPRLELFSALLLSWLMDTVIAVLERDLAITARVSFLDLKCYAVLDLGTTKIMEALCTESCHRDLQFDFCGMLESLSRHREPCGHSITGDITTRTCCE